MLNLGKEQKTKFMKKVFQMTESAYKLMENNILQILQSNSKKQKQDKHFLGLQCAAAVVSLDFIGIQKKKLFNLGVISFQIWRHKWKSITKRVSIFRVRKLMSSQITKSVLMMRYMTNQIIFGQQNKIVYGMIMPIITLIYSHFMS